MRFNLLKVKYLLLLLLLLFSFNNISAQTQRVAIKFGDVKVQDFAPTAYAVDSSADAVYLFDGGKSDFQGSDIGGGIEFNILFTHHARIRLLKKTSFSEAGTIEIPIETEYSNYYVEKVISFKAAVYNINNGNVSVINADEKDLLKDNSYEKGERTYTSYKYTFPGVKEGCIIEYTYTVLYPSYVNLHSWTFQGTYPRLWSEYEVTIPSFYSYVISRHGYVKYDIDAAKELPVDYSIKDKNNSQIPGGRIFGAYVNTINHVWATKNVEAIKEEPFITSMNNYIARLEFQLYYWQYPDQQKNYYTLTWPDFVKKYFIDDKDFGMELYGDNKWLGKDIDAVASEAKDPLDEAKKIYAYARDNFSANDKNDRPLYLSQPLKTTYSTNQGTVADINLLLTAMLIRRNLDAKPVILSTRHNGKPLDNYPIIDQYNYLITKVSIGGQDYFLDASDKNTAFGYLPEKCYNDSCFTIEKTPEFISLSADSINNSRLTSVFIFNGDKGMEGNYTSSLGYFESADTRDELQREKKEDFFGNIKKSYLFDVDVNNASINSLNDPDEPLKIKYDFTFNNDSADIIYFAPMLSEAIKENPFKSADRIYPVEMPYCSDRIYTLSMEIPKGYAIDELPKSAKVALPENDAIFQYTIAKTDTSLQLNCRLKFNRANFDPEAYNALRSFYAYVVEKESEQVVFKRIK